LIERANHGTNKLKDSNKLIIMSYYESSLIAALLAVIPNER